MAQALPGLRILDFSRVLAGPLATMVLADLGANVTKVERPIVGDETRQWGPPYDDRGESTYFESVNRNKTSIVLDLADHGDLGTARALARDADVVVENFRPGVMDRLGLGYEALKTENDDLILCSITGFGTGDGARLPGYDLLVQAVGGLMSITGAPHGEPQKVGVALVDVITGLYASVGILAALQHRDCTGEGQRVEVDLLSCLLSALVNQASAYTLAGVVAGRMGNAHPSIAPYEPYRAADSDLVIAVGNERQFSALCQQLEAPTLVADPRFSTNSARVDNREALKAELEARLATQSASDWVVILNDAGVPAGKVNDIAEAFAFAERLGLDPTVEIARARGGSARLARNPIRLSATPAIYHTAPPSLPSHRRAPR